MTAIRIVIGIIIGAIVVVAAVPMLVLLDMAGGGDGWGICPDGIASCSTSYFDGPELVGWLMVLIFLLMMALRAALHMQRLIDGRRSRVDPSSVGRRSGFDRD